MNDTCQCLKTYKEINNNDYFCIDLLLLSGISVEVLTSVKSILHNVYPSFTCSISHLQYNYRKGWWFIDRGNWIPLVLLQKAFPLIPTITIIARIDSLIPVKFASMVIIQKHLVH